MRWLLLSATVVAAAALAGCGKPGPSGRGAQAPAEIGDATERGKKAADALMARLKSQLQAAMQSGGPVEAVSVCQNIALPLTEAEREAQGVAGIRRTTLKPRNPANAPDAMDRSVLEAMAAAANPGSEVRADAGGSTRYYQPIFVQEVCLKCHGDRATMPPALTEKLAALYPSDLATGYALGDFRGAIRVDFAPEP